MYNVIAQILEKTKEDLEKRKKKVPLGMLAQSVLPKEKTNRLTLLLQKPKVGEIAIIGEIKLASPSAGILGSRKDVLERASIYNDADVDMLSVVTEKHFFKGDPVFISEIKQTGISLPILQKDFIVDSYQIYESAMVGADAVLLVARLLTTQVLREFVDLAIFLGLEPIVEIYDDEDMKKVFKTNTFYIAVNARDLDTFSINMEKACSLLDSVDDDFFKLGFSGVSTKNDVLRYAEAGARAVLVGTALMKAQNIQEFILSLRAHSISSV